MVPSSSNGEWWRKFYPPGARAHSPGHTPDCDGHYYEARGAFTRHAEKSMRQRGVQWVESGGRARLVVGGVLNNYIPNPTFDPVSKPGALYEWFRGNPRRPRGRWKPSSGGIRM